MNAKPKPGFHIADADFTYDLPLDFCPASKDWHAAFAPIMAENPDKALLGELVECTDNARYANSPNYIVITTYSDAARQQITPEGLQRDFKPNMDNPLFLSLLNSPKTYADLQRAVAGAPGQPLGEGNNTFPLVRDEHCLYSGGRYGEVPMTPENSATVINCTMSVGGRQIMIMHNGDGKQDLLVMARRLGKLAASIAVGS